MADKPKLDNFHYHEALDRLHIITCMIDDHLIQHPVFKLETEERRLIEDAQLLLADAYQRIGNKY
jgi:hypothetical protein